MIVCIWLQILEIIGKCEKKFQLDRNSPLLLAKSLHKSKRVPTIVFVEKRKAEQRDHKATSVTLSNRVTILAEKLVACRFQVVQES